MAYIGHRMWYKDKTAIAAEALLIPSPLYVYVGHVLDAMDHMTAQLMYQPCPLIITYKNGLQ